MVRALNWNQKDVQQNGSLSFETLLPGEWGSYGGWWVMAYDRTALANAAASEAELLALTQPQVAAPQPVPAATQPAATTANDIIIINTNAPPPEAAVQPATTTPTTNYGYGYGYGYGWIRRMNLRAARPVTAAAAATPVRQYPRSYCRQRLSAHLYPCPAEAYDVRRRCSLFVDSELF